MSIEELIKCVNTNLDFINANLTQADKCAGQIRGALECAVKIFWQKKGGEFLEWAKDNDREYDLYSAIQDARFAESFDDFVLSDIHKIRQNCNSAVHGKSTLALELAQKMAERLVGCIRAIEKAIPLQILRAPAMPTPPSPPSSSGKSIVDPPLTVVITNQEISYEWNRDERGVKGGRTSHNRKSGYLTQDTSGNDIGLVFESDDKRTVRCGSAEIMFFRSGAAQYGRWRLIKIDGARLPYDVLKAHLRENVSYTVITDGRWRKA